MGGQGDGGCREKQRPWLHTNNQGLRLGRQWGDRGMGVAALLAHPIFQDAESSTPVP